MEDIVITLRINSELLHRAQKEASKEDRARSFILRRWLMLGEKADAASRYKELKLKDG
jgi:hypothetical protein